MLIYLYKINWALPQIKNRCRRLNYKSFPKKTIRKLHLDVRFNILKSNENFGIFLQNYVVHYWMLSWLLSWVSKPFFQHKSHTGHSPNHKICRNIKYFRSPILLVSLGLSIHIALLSNFVQFNFLIRLNVVFFTNYAA